MNEEEEITAWWEKIAERRPVPLSRETSNAVEVALQMLKHDAEAMPGTVLNTVDHAAKICGSPYGAVSNTDAVRKIHAAAVAYADAVTIAVHDWSQNV